MPVSKALFLETTGVVDFGFFTAATADTIAVVVLLQQYFLSAILLAYDLRTLGHWHCSGSDSHWHQTNNSFPPLLLSRKPFFLLFSWAIPQRSKKRFYRIFFFFFFRKILLGGVQPTRATHIIDLR